MHEHFISYLWRYRRFRPDALLSTSGQPIEIIHPGELNTNSGPDFSNARIRIDDTLWAGNVELHVRASDWIRHRHSRDRAYDNTILHVVYEADVEIPDQNGQNIACLELQHRIDPQLHAKYSDLVSQKHAMCGACQADPFCGVVWLA
jgi:Protein of unknown function (DUF2851)